MRRFWRRALRTRVDYVQPIVLKRQHSLPNDWLSAPWMWLHRGSACQLHVMTLPLHAWHECMVCMRCMFFMLLGSLPHCLLALLALQRWLSALEASEAAATATGSSSIGSSSTGSSSAGKPASELSLAAASLVAAKALYVLDVTRLRADWADWSVADNAFASPEVGEKCLSEKLYAVELLVV